MQVSDLEMLAEPGEQDHPGTILTVSASRPWTVYSVSIRAVDS